MREFEVVGLTETWVDEAGWEKLKEKMPEGWKWKCQPARRKSKKGRARGGIITGVRKEIEEREIGEKEIEGIQERELIIDKERWRIITLYNREGRRKGLERVNEGIREGEEGNLVIAGDFNARTGEEGGWNDQEEAEEAEEGGKRRSKDEVINKQGRELIRMLEERG